jgi:hypothetical protein
MFRGNSYLSMPLSREYIPLKPSVNLTGLVPDTQLRRPTADRVLMPMPTPTIFNLPK